ncbi:MAG: antitoxin Xre/MbcA/ParS toxin-binding domain-containing protein [Candidatus Baltobacteraceae bacterium]
MATLSPISAETVRILDLVAADLPDELALAGLVGRGLPTHSIDVLLEMGMAETDIHKLVLSRRTFQRRRTSHSVLTPEESDRTERVARILALARLVLGDTPRAMNWLSTTKRRFDNRRPLDLLVSSVGTKIVEETLLQAYYGNVA